MHTYVSVLIQIDSHGCQEHGTSTFLIKWRKTNDKQ
ncbi:hypothetical protein E9G_01838 [Moraxella catarrhalis 7169]|nr:hypothetical protein E9G_01838 [Moraxella catarrhalis 7169]EGE21948.1 hypothetical protein E9U_01866 [Moraxella catarrhalis BC8]EGE26365.1 hypothetical protein E9W_00095 [Moraxella catarrhalis CO72]EGE27792.1 hypothetical protein EA1_00335 [Moraxella catarrhalis O35E]